MTALRLTQCLLFVLLPIATARKNRISQTKPPTIIEQPKSGLFERRETVKLYCNVKGNPPPVVTWYKDGVLHEYNQRSWSSQDDLIISNFDQSDVGDYKCRAENILGVTDSDTAKIELKYFNKIFKSQPIDTAVVVGQTLMVPCVPPDGYPEPEVEWYQGQGGTMNLINVRSSDRIKYRDGSLVISPVMESDAGDYECRASNAAGRAISRRGLVRVNVKPYLRSAPVKSVSLTEGDRGQLNCNYDGVPPPRISWSKLEGPIDSKAVEKANGTLEIGRLEVGDEGSYQCTAENTAGSMSSQIILKIRRGPKFTRLPRDRSVKAGQDVEFKCQVDGEPKPGIYWRRDDEILINDERYQISSTGTLRIVKTTVDDSGVYVCEGKNNIGVSKTEVTLTVKDFSLNEPPIVLRVRQSSKDTFSCLVQNAKVEETVWKGPDGRMLRSGATQIIQTDGNYSCQATNQYGSAELAFTYPLAGPVSAATKLLTNLTMTRTQANSITVTFRTEETLENQVFNLYQLDPLKRAFISIEQLIGGSGPIQKFKVKLSSLLNESGAFYVRDTRSLVSSMSTGFIDLSQKNFTVKASGIQPVECTESTDGSAKLEWVVSDTVAESCAAGYSVITSGPRDDFKTVPCDNDQVTLAQSELDQVGQYSVRIESRENNELGALFILTVSEGRITCDDLIVKNVSYAWQEEGLTLKWRNGANSDQIYFDKYQIIGRDVSIEKSLSASEIQSTEPNSYEYTIDKVQLVDDNYTLRIIPITSSAQGFSGQITIDTNSDATFLKNLLQSPVFAAILSSIIVIAIILTGASVFVCCCRKKKIPTHRPQKKSRIFTKKGRKNRNDEHDMLKNDIELLNGSESWNRTLAQTLIPDFQPLKETAALGSGAKVEYGTPDIQSSHFTISPVKHELVHVDLLEGTHSYSSSSHRKLPPPPPQPYHTYAKQPMVTDRVHDSSTSSGASSMSDYRRQDVDRSRYQTVEGYRDYEHYYDLYEPYKVDSYQRQQHTSAYQQNAFQDYAVLSPVNEV